jgi:hypothetical protein
VASRPHPADPDEIITAKITPNAAQLSWLMIKVVLLGREEVQ